MTDLNYPCPRNNLEENAPPVYSHPLDILPVVKYGLLLSLLVYDKNK